MIRRLACLLALAAAVAGPAAAQSGAAIYLQFADVNADSVFGAVSGGTVDVTLQSYDYAGRGVNAFSVTLQFDPGQLQFVSAWSLCPDSATYPLTATPLAAGVRLQAAGCSPGASYYRSLAVVRLQFAGGATNGSTLYLRADSLRDVDATDRTLVTLDAASQVCHASGTWGDVDGDGNVNSRDALIALSHAVGLPTTPYTVDRGDVDYDGITSSRDALYMLTASIGGYVYSTRIGRPSIDNCAAEYTLPRPLYFARGSNTPGTIANGSGFAYRSAGSATFTLVGDSAHASAPEYWRMRVSPDGQSVLFICYTDPPGGYPYASYNVCRADATGGNPVSLTNDGAYYTSADWSPDGTQIVAVRDYRIFVMDANGGNMAQIPASRTSVYSVSWHPVLGSNRILYSTYTDSVLWRSWNDSLGTDTVVAANPAVDFGNVEWSPAGDSLAVDVRYYASPTYVHATWAAAATVGAPLTPRFALSLNYSGSTAPVWTNLGLLLGYYDPIGRHGLFFLRSDGAPFRLMRNEQRSHFAPGMSRQ
jgi:hypothetical protein